MPKISETETVVKKIIPYLTRRGYDVDADFSFEFPAAGTSRATLGFIDILVHHSGKIAFLVEAKRIAKNLSQKDRDQAIQYGRDVKAAFVVVTNGVQFESYNSTTGKRIRWNSKISDKVPSKKELATALAALRKDIYLTEVPLKNDDSLPFRPGLPLKQLNSLFARCHNTIRKIERNEDHAFADFAKIMFLKLLEEKSDDGSEKLEYTYRFHELAEKPEKEADQVKDAAIKMLDQVKQKTPYGDVLTEDIHLKNAKTFQKIVRELSNVSFRDSRTDSKGAAFEYFVRATLKGKKLGQYFTPRPLVELMHGLIGPEKILNTLAFSGDMRVVDPACGTGGFLVYLMLSAIEQANDWRRSGKINASKLEELQDKIRKKVFFGADAHQGVASSAKMNMIIAGDGHSNIQCEDTLSVKSKLWTASAPDIDLIITNPPFGTSESESLTDDDLGQFPVRGARGQILFVQKMIQATKAGGEICTVIDEGLLNTVQARELRKYIMQETRIKGIIRLPDSTFKPNKINVKSSILHLVKREECDIDNDLDDEYAVLCMDIYTLGYQGSGDPIRNLDFGSIVYSISKSYHGKKRDKIGETENSDQWQWFTRSSLDIAGDLTHRFDFKYWETGLTSKLSELKESSAKTIKQLNSIETKRGKSPPAGLYVDEEDGFALVIKAGTNISKQGEVLREGDYIEKNIYDEMKSVHVKNGDILLSSTGDGTLGKCAVYRSDSPAIFDVHVTLIRVNPAKVCPEYLCDYLRAGFGAAQVARLYTGSTGLIELPPDLVDRILVDLPSMSLQKKRSNALRAAEAAYAKSIDAASTELGQAVIKFKIS